MECRVSDAGAVRVLARVLQCAARVGDDVSFTAAASGLVVRAVNASASAAASFTLRRSFFCAYRAGDSGAAAVVPGRSLLPALRAPASVAAARLRLEAGGSALVLRVTARSGVTKTFRVPALGAPPPAPVYDKRRCGSYLLTRARFLADVLANFHARLDEITLAPHGSGLRVASFVDDAGRGAGGDAHTALLRTEMVVDAREFDVFRVAPPQASPAPAAAALTFHCRPFRAVLEFCEALDLPLAVWFATSGLPMVFGVEMGATPGGKTNFEADFVFATRLAEDLTQQQPLPQSTPVAAASAATGAVYSAGNDDTSDSRATAAAPATAPPRSAARRKPKLPLTPVAAPAPARRASSLLSGGRRRLRESPTPEDDDAPDESVFASPGKRRGAASPAAALQSDANDDVAMPTQYHHEPGSAGHDAKTDVMMNDADSQGDDDDEYVDGTPPPE